MIQFFDHTRAEAFIRELFHVVLDRPEPGSEELEYWTSYIVENQNPTHVLTLFGESIEYQARLTRLRDANRGWPSGHFYSPIVNKSEVEQDKERLFARRAPLAVDLNVLEQKVTFRTLAQHLRALPFADEHTPGLRYYYNNTSYAFGDAFGYWGMLNIFRPKRIIEVGCGFTSALALDAIEALGLDTVCTFIDPYPELLLRVASPIDKRHEIIADRIQTIDPKTVESLGAGDIFFIDSSHVMKTGSDVTFEILELLPRLASGVIIHFHDVFDGFEYPYGWVVDLGQSWNELYALQSFLMFNERFKIIYFNDFFARECDDQLSVLPDSTRHRIRENPGGGLWLRKS
jgi:hypothetical protein